MNEQVKKSGFFEFCIRLAATFAGSRGNLSFSVLTNLTLGVIYSFKIWNQPAILIIFGIALPFIYTIAVYTLIKKVDFQKQEGKFMKFARNKIGNIILMIIDLCILIVLGILILNGSLDFIILRIFYTIILPFLYLNSIHVMLNYKPED